MKYLVRWDYQAEWKNQLVRLFAGETATLDDDVAEFVQRDSPGCVEPVIETATLSVDNTDQTPERALDEAPQDRQLKRAPKKRADREGAPGDPGAITKDTFKAVRDKP